MRSSPTTGISPSASWQTGNRAANRRYLEALHEVSLALMRRLDVADVLNTIVRRAGELLETAHGFVALVSEDGTSLEFMTGSGVYDTAGTTAVESGEGIAGVVWQTGEPVMVADYSCWPQRRMAPSTAPIRATIGVPLVSHDRVIGVLSLAYTEGGGHSTRRPSRRWVGSRNSPRSRWTMPGSTTPRRRKSASAARRRRRCAAAKRGTGRCSRTIRRCNC